MPGVARTGDMGLGTCLAHQSPLPITTVFTGAPFGVVNVGSQGISSCGHSTIALTGSPTVFAEGLPVHRLGDSGMPPIGSYSVIMASTTVLADTGVVNPLPEAIKADASLVYNEVQSGTSYFDAVTVSNDDSDHSVAVLPPLDGSRSPTEEEKRRSKAAGVDPDAEPGAPVDNDAAPPDTEPPSSVVDCSVFSSTTEYAETTQLSPNFTLADLSTRTALSKANVNSVSSVNGVPRSQIVCNLANLAVNVLEPLVELLETEFPGHSLILTSVFRVNGKLTSQHRIGQAGDNQFGGFSLQQYWDFARIVKDRLVYDQFILEYIGTNPWFHLSFNKIMNRRQVLTCRKTGLYEAGLIRAR